MDEHEVQRHIAVLEDRLAEMTETQAEILGVVDALYSEMQLLRVALSLPPETGEPEQMEMGRAH